MKDNIRKTIALFWKGKLSIDEQKKLLGTIQDDTTSFKQELEKEFGTAANDDGLPDDRQYQEILHHVHQKMGVVGSAPHKMAKIRKWSVAASLFFLMGIAGAIFIWYSSPVSDPTQRMADVNLPDTLIWYNKSDSLQHKILSDGSKIILSPHSSINYTDRYGVHDRKMTLVGKAEFHVARDTTRPFTVLADGYSTTALGTVFVINTADHKSLSVKLLSGKVIVKSTTLHKYSLVDQILKPGDELWIDKDTEKWSKRNPAAERTDLLATANKKKIEKKDDAYQTLWFDRTPLDEVFGRIEKFSNREIRFDQTEIEGLFFTGQFTHGDSFEMMLNIICQMNDLQHETVDSKIRIRKKDTVHDAQHERDK